MNGGHVTSFVRALGSQRFLASFVPHEVVTHLVEMTFNGEVVPGKSFFVIGILVIREKILRNKFSKKASYPSEVQKLFSRRSNETRKAPSVISLCRR